ncbi:MAG TPA: YggS family pyridoxal phosphate-dependent enzyme [Steroidobacteraceae bacterium]|nr:YggS family pyridoxal phosphate-dependent enzyme [Steroidobacteraceae bacterium]
MLIAPQISAADAGLARRLQQLRAAIAAAAAQGGRTEQSVTLVAVSKGQGADRVRAAAALGLTHFGESYVQEALPKRRALAELALCWHFIGRIQANKTRPIAEQFDWVHGLDRLQIAERLSAQRPAAAAPLNVCLHVNIAAEASKAGVAPAELPGLAGAVARLPRLALRGLMCILPAGQSERSNRAHFRALRELLVDIDAGRGRLDTLSMGMSADFREAVLEGATLLRVGTALFGARPGRDPDTGGGDGGGGAARGDQGPSPPAAGVG